jgi:hypothetical protein
MECSWVGSLLNQTWQKITQLIWRSQVWVQYYNLSRQDWTIHLADGDPAPGPAGPGSYGRPPSGPIKNAIASTMANRSGVGQGYIMGAMKQEF